LDSHYDVLIVGSGAGGGTLAWKLAQTGHSILLLERGDFLPRERENWDAEQLWVHQRYRNEKWLDHRGREFSPEAYYCIGGNTKFYGAVLGRFRRQDFEQVVHAEGISPAWPLRYDDFEPYYGEAENLYQVHGIRAEEPTEPDASTPFPFPAISHEPRVEALHQELAKLGYHPSHLPMGVMLDESRPLESRCVRCNNCGGFPCLLHAKCDAEVIAVRPAMQRPNVTVVTRAEVVRILTDQAGRMVTGVRFIRDGETCEVGANIVALAAGSSNSAKLLLNSRNDQHPRGLANRSDQVGRNFVLHHRTVLLALFRQPNDTKFQATMALNDFYFGDEEFPFPMGRLQMMVKLRGEMLRGKSSRWLPKRPLDWLTRHTVEFLLTAEDLPEPDNRITITADGRIRLSYRPNNLSGMRRLENKVKEVLRQVSKRSHLFSTPIFIQHRVGIAGLGHQAGTCKMGTDPATSVLNTDCRAHDLENLYVVDGSFFPSIGACNPTLTIIANALRVGERIAEKLV
jgi:choline dehydrogenase-like flavoprotein